MNLNKKINFVILLTVILVCFGFAGKAGAATYHTSGTLVSENLLSAQNVDSIDKFGYDATIPANTSLKVQFTQNQTNWYNSAGAENGWDTLSDGDYLASGDAIDLSGLGWSGPYFYYKIEFGTTDTAVTPVLDEIKLYWDEGAAPATAYHTSGTLVSNNILDEVEVDNIINSFYYNVSSIPAGASLRVQFSQDNTNWYNSAEEADGWDNFSEGANLIDLSGLRWSSLNFYYKIEFTSDGTDTPILDEIKVYYMVSSVGIKGSTIRIKGAKVKIK